MSYLTDQQLKQIADRAKKAVGAKWTVVADRESGDPEEIVGLPRHMLESIVRELLAARSLVGGSEAFE